jgi:predicted PurR-regulated permease PerM
VSTPDDDDLLVPGHPADDLPPKGLGADEVAREDAAARADASDVLEGDPLVDTAVRRYEAGADDDNPYGLPGRPISRRSPFYLGLMGGLGLAVAYLLTRIISGVSSVLVIVVVSMFLAIGLNPAVEALMRRGASRRASVSVVFLGVIAFFIGFGAAIVPPVVSQTSNFAQNYSDYIDKAEKNKTVKDLDSKLHFIEPLKKQVKDGKFVNNAFGGVLGATKTALSATFTTLTILILTLYFVSSLPTIKRAAYQLVPRSRRSRFGLLADEILLRIGGYVGGALGIALIAGMSTFILLEILGVPYALALAMVVTVTDLIPLIGATIGAAVVTVVALLSSVTDGLVCLAFYIAYQQIENFIIYPRIMRRSVAVPPVVTVIAALVGGTLLGVVGALLAIPTAAAVLLIIEEVVVPRQDTT